MSNKTKKCLRTVPFNHPEAAIPYFVFFRLSLYGSSYPIVRLESQTPAVIGFNTMSRITSKEK